MLAASTGAIVGLAVIVIVLIVAFFLVLGRARRG